MRCRIAEGVLGIIEDTARREGIRAVRRLRLEIGQLAAVETRALRFCFESWCAAASPRARALEIDETPGRAWCFGCCASVPLASRVDPCPRCGSSQLQVSGGTRCG